MRSITFLLAVLAIAPLTRVTAQEPPPVKPGDRVRVTHGCVANARGDLRCEKTATTLAALATDGLLLGDAEPYVEVSISTVNTFEVSRGRKSKTGTGALIGTGVGAAAGVITALVTCADNGCDYYGSDYTGLAVLVLGGGGALLGAGIGAVVGSQIKVERWVGVTLDQLRVSFAPQRDGRFGLGLSVRF